MRIDMLQIDGPNGRLVELEVEIEGALALVGFSGSGKSLTLKALAGILPTNLTVSMRVTADFELQRGKTVGLLPQNPFTSLSPMSTVGKQFFAPHKESAPMMQRVGLSPELLERYPSQLSGGQLQRAMLAMVLLSRPRLLLLDEPTTALDAATKKSIMDLLVELQKEFGFLMVFVTHELKLAAKYCPQMAVMEAGRIVERGLSKEIALNPKSSAARRLARAHFGDREFRQ